MPDISMCPGGDCAIKESCLRYNAKPTEYRQSYFVSPPYLSTSALVEIPSQKFLMSVKRLEELPDATWDYCPYYWHYPKKLDE